MILYKQDICFHFFFFKKWVILPWEIVWKFLKKLKIEPSYNPAIPLLGIYPKKLKTGSQRHICIPLVIAALFTLAKR